MRNEMQHGEDNGLGRLVEYLGDVWGGDVGRNAIQAEGCRDEYAVEPRLIIDDTSACGGLEASCKGEVKRMDEELVREFWRLMEDKDVS